MPLADTEGHGQSCKVVSTDGRDRAALLDLYLAWTHSGYVMVLAQVLQIGIKFVHPLPVGFACCLCDALILPLCHHIIMTFLGGRPPVCGIIILKNVPVPCLLRCNPLLSQILLY